MSKLDPARDGPDVSVVIPAFRAAGFIGRAIDSALAQTGVSLEVIVVDDACPERTGDAVEARYASVPDVTVLRLPVNGGPSVARNTGFKAARGEWIAVLDADDAFAEGRLSRLVEAGRGMGADVVADNIRLYDATSGTLSDLKIKSVERPTQVDIHMLVDRGRPRTGELDFGLLKPCFRRSFLQGTSLGYRPDVRHGEDFLFYFDLVQAGAKFVVLPEGGYHWTLRGSGQSQTKVDYRSIMRDTAELRRRPDVAGDERLVRALQVRVDALAKFRAERAYFDALKNKDYARALRTCLASPRLFRFVLRSVLEKLRPGSRR